MTTTATVDSKRRVRIPDAEPGQLVTIQSGPAGWTLSPVKPETQEMFPPGSLLEYMTPERDQLETEIFNGCVKGPE